MAPLPDELAARYGRPYRKAERIEISPERFEKGRERGDDGAWGVGALVVREGRGLFVREDATWLLSGGRLEAGERPEAGAKREVLEETGLEIEIVDLCAIAEQTFVNEEHDDSYTFHFATFLGVPDDSSAQTLGSADPAIDEVAWHERVPSNTFDRELVRRLFETYI